MSPSPVCVPIDSYGTINELASAEKINSSYVSRVLRLTLLAPELVEAILDGRQPEGMTLPGLMEPFPADWLGHAARFSLLVRRSQADSLPRQSA